MKPHNKGIWGFTSNLPFLTIFLPFLLLPISLPCLPSVEAKEWEEIQFRGMKLSIKRDPITQAPMIINGLQYNIGRYIKKKDWEKKEQIEAGKKFIGDLFPILKLDPKDLEIKSIDKVESDWFLSYWQLYRGVLIYDSTVGFSIDRKGNIHSMGALIHPNIEMDVTPKISEQEASRIAFKHLRKKGWKLFASRLVVYPKRKGTHLSYELVYALNLFPAESVKQPLLEGGGYAYFVNAKNGKTVHHEEILSLLGCCAPYEEDK